MADEDFWEMTEDARITRIESLLREHQLHESECPVRRQQVHNAMGGTYMSLLRPCDCWLSGD